MTVPRIITENLGGGPLARAAIARDTGVAPWYVERPATPGAWRARSHEVRATARDGWLSALGPAFDARGAALARLQRAASGGVVVSTGQQAALFGGPLYTYTKALTALALADALERATGVPAAPVFWAATDDADFAEAATVLVSMTGGARALRLPTPARQGIAMSALTLPDMRTLVAELAAACGTVSDTRTLAAVRDTFTAGTSLGTAYVSLLRRLFEPLGIAVLDASHVALRVAARPLLERALERASTVDAALEERQHALVAAGFTPQVERVPGLSLVFDTDDRGEKRRVPIARAADASMRPVEALSPNVLLRPLIERAIMPSVGYAAGPGEIAYFAQVSAVARALDIDAPLVVPRWSATVLEPRIERLLQRLETTIEELAQPERLEGRLARAALPAPLDAQLARIRAHVSGDLDGLASLDGEGLVSRAALEGTERWMLHRLARLERRYVAAMKRRERDLMHDVATAHGALFPEGKRQERALSFIPFLARYGDAFVSAMRVAANAYAGALVGDSAAMAAATIPAPARASKPRIR